MVDGSNGNVGTTSINVSTSTNVGCTASKSDDRRENYTNTDSDNIVAGRMMRPESFSECYYTNSPEETLEWLADEHSRRLFDEANRVLDDSSNDSSGSPQLFSVGAS